MLMPLIILTKLRNRGISEQRGYGEWNALEEFSMHPLYSMSVLLSHRYVLKLLAQSPNYSAMKDWLDRESDTLADSTGKIADTTSHLRTSS